MILNRENLAEFLGCSLRTVDEYVRQGMPGEAPKRQGAQWKFDSGTVVGWLRERERTEALGEVSKVDEGEARRRKIAADAALAEHELALKVGAAVSIADFETAWSAMIGAARAKFLGLGSALGPDVALIKDPAECTTVIDSAVKEALRELSERAPEVQLERAGTDEPDPLDEEAVETVRPAAGPDGKRVGGRGKTAKPRK